MAAGFDPLTGQLILFPTGSGGGGAASWRATVATEAGLSTSGNNDGDAVVTLDTDFIWVWDATTSRWINTGVKSATFGSTPGSAGYSLDYVNVASNRREFRLTLQPADATNPGGVSTGTQTIAGNKTLSGTTTLSALNSTGVVHNNSSGVLSTSLIVNADVSTTAAIAYSKLSLTDSIVNADVNSAAAIAYSKLNLALSVKNSDVATNAAIAYSKLNLSSSIVNADVATNAAITYSKLSLTDSIKNSDISSVAAIDASKIANGSVSNTEFQYLDGVTSSIQTQLGNRVLSSDLASTSTGLGASLVGVETTTRLITNLDVAITGSTVQTFLEDISFNLGYVRGMTESFTAGESFAANTAFAVRLAISGETVARIYKADKDASTTNKYDAIGIVYSSVLVNAGDNVDVRLSGFKTVTAATYSASDIGKEVFVGSSGAVILGSALSNIPSEAAFCIGTVRTTGVIQVDFKQLRSGPGEIREASFSAANNQSAAANVTGLVFANAYVRSFRAMVSVFINATSSLYEQFELQGIQKGASWNMSSTSIGDTSNIVFTITSAGQVQYTSGNESGFVANTMKFRAWTTSV